MSPLKYRPRYYGEYEMGEREAAELLGVTRRQLVALCERGEGPYHVFIGGRARYSLKDLIQFCSSRKNAPLSKPKHDHD